MELVKVTADNQLALLIREYKIPDPAKIVKRALKIANKKEDAPTMLKIADWIADVSELKPNKIKITESRQINSNLQDNFQKAQNDKVKVTVSTEVNAKNDDNNHDKKVDNEE